MPIDNSAAQTATTALQAIPFGSLIGGPLDACIQAQAKAAKTSWEFIQNVGLTEDPVTKEKKAINVTFQYNKNGEMVNLVVPLLTIVPIPFLAINQVVIDFMANISAASSTLAETSSSEDLSAGGSAQGKIGWGPFSVSFEAHANYSSKKDSKASQESKYSVEYTMNVHVEGGQADMPAGLAAILNILQSSVTEAPTGGGLSISPQNSILQGNPGARIYIEATAKDGLGLLQKGSRNAVNLGNPPKGMTLKPIEVVRGQAEGDTTPTTATIIADEKGVIGINIVVDKIDTDYKPGAIDVNVAAILNNSGSSGKAATVSSTGKIKTTAALPGAISLVADKSPVEIDSAPLKVTLTYKDATGAPITGKTISASVNNANCTVTPASGLSNQLGVVEFEVAKGTSAVGGDQSIVTFSADGVITTDQVTIKKTGF